MCILRHKRRSREKQKHSHIPNFLVEEAASFPPGIYNRRALSFLLLP
jgi:hypothetical protein